MAAANGAQGVHGGEAGNPVGIGVTPGVHVGEVAPGVGNFGLQIFQHM